MSESSDATSERPRRFRLCSDVRYRVVGGQAVIIVQEAGEAIVLNEVGTRVLELVSAGADRKEMIADLDAQYDAGLDRITADLGAYLDELTEAGVIETAD